MQQRAIEINKVLAAAVIAIGLGFSSGQARSEDFAEGSLPVASAVDAGKTRPVLMKAMVAGGLRRGDVMRLGAGGGEIVTPAQLAQRSNRGPESCITY